MNQKQAKQLRQSLRTQGINPKETVYIGEMDVLRNNPNPKLSPNSSVFGKQTVLLYKECGRAVYKSLKSAFKAFQTT